MERIRVTFVDRNTEIERQLPLDATLVEKVALEDSPSEWWLVAFERALSHVGAEFPYALVAPRHTGHSLADSRPISAVLLLSASRALPANAKVSSFPQVVWCGVKRIDA